MINKRTLGLIIVLVVAGAVQAIHAYISPELYTIINATLLAIEGVLQGGQQVVANMQAKAQKNLG